MEFNDDSMRQLTELDAWKALKSHGDMLPLQRMGKVKPNLLQYPFVLHQNGIHIDFRYQLINITTCELLVKLAKEQELEQKIQALMDGSQVNTTEQRPALHTALRASQSDSIFVDGRNIVCDVIQTREKMREISDKIRALRWCGYNGKPITDIVNIGIGGSDFGPRFCVDALSHHTATHLKYHFISDADPNAFKNIVNTLNQDTTLFIVSSKSFTTKETLMNAQKAVNWLGNEVYVAKHFIAVTANVEAAKSFGIECILPIWAWIGGRFSFCSAINLIGCIALGFEQFMQLLQGAHDMDMHFKNAPLIENMPVMLALIGIWNINFLHIPNLLCLVYARQLEKFVPYLQQLDMESNGKSIDIHGRVVNYATGPLVWGGMGNQAQHSYFQLLCQGSHSVAADFISTNEFEHDLINNICSAKIKVLAEGIQAEGNGFIPGGTPINHIRLEACSPYHLGSLVALYEHKTYVQGAIWNINVFDQPGVENAKRVLFNDKELVEELGLKP